ncbi:MAG: ASCH domain-containing protein, partial [Nitrososphaera sp.]
LAQAAQVTKAGALVAISLFPVNTRPNAIIERWKVLEIAQMLGLHIQSIEAGGLGYETPLFELASLRSSGVEIDGNWRKGDLVLLRKVYHPQQEVISEIFASTPANITEMEKWAEFVLDLYKVKLRGPFDDYSEVPELISIEKDDILPTVSRRYSRRELIDLWLWDNRVFAVKGKASFWAALHTLTGKALPNSGDKITEANHKRALELLRQIIGNIEFRVSIHGEKNSNGTDSETSLLIRLQEQLYENEKTLNVEVLTQICSQANIRGHLAILTQPYLDKIIVGKKTIESRFSKMRVPPFYKVQKGDILLLKETAGPIAAIALVSNVKFFGPLKPRDVELVMEEYGDGLALEEAFTKAKQDSKYATLINIGQVLPVKPLAIAKSDRRAWVVLNDGTQNRLF